MRRNWLVLTCWFALEAMMFEPLIAAETVVDQNLKPLVLHTRSIDAKSPPSVASVKMKTVNWNPRLTALVICDMWDNHWCRSTRRRTIRPDE